METSEANVIEKNDQSGKKCGYCTYTDERRGVDRLRIGMRLVGKTKVGSLHAKSKENEHQSHVGVHIGDDAVAA